MYTKILIIILMIGLWTLSSTCHAQQRGEYPATGINEQAVSYPSKSRINFPEEQIIRKAFEVTRQWQTFTFEIPLQINRKGLMSLHLAVDKQLYISTMVNHPLNPECNKPGCAINAFCLRRLSDGVLIRPEAVLVADNGVEVKVRPAGHLYPNFDKNVITLALRACKDAYSHPLPFPKGIKTIKAIRIRGTEPFQIKFLYWNVDRYPTNQ
jgi:hypothetical protein